MNPIKNNTAADSLCPHCGAINFEMAVYCRQCDRPMDGSPEAKPLPPPDDLETERIRRRKLPPAVTGPLVLQPASGWRVLVAFATDALLLVGVGAAVTLSELALRQAVFEPSFWGFHDIAAEWLYVNSTEVQHGLIAAIVFGLLMAMRPGGRTLGRVIAGTVLVRASGKPFSVAAWLLRLIGLMLSSAFLGLGFLWALFDPQYRTTHDVLAGTVSVRRRIHRASTTDEKA
ncbi:MAG: RDD family protein [Myxococcota bacterium]